MSMPLPTQEENWRKQWIATIRARARQEVPRWLRSVSAARLEPLKPERQNTESIAPVATTHASGRRHTEPIPKTLTIPIVQLLPESETRALASAAVRWFYQQHRCLPTAIALNPLRCLAVNQSFFPVDCEDLGCYTVEIFPVAELARDVVMVVGKVVSILQGRYVWGEVTDFYL